MQDIADFRNAGIIIDQVLSNFDTNMWQTGLLGMVIDGEVL
jgi:hypothetical protein